MYYYIINSRIQAHENALDSEFYNYEDLNETNFHERKTKILKLTPSQAEFYEQNLNASVQEVLNEQLTVKTAEELLQDSKSAKLSTFQQWLREQSEVVNEFTVNGKTIKLKANDKVKQNLQDLKGVLDDQIALGMFDAATDTYDTFFNEGEATPISITYNELLQIRLQIANIIGNLYTKNKTIPTQIQACNTIEEVETVTWI